MIFADPARRARPGRFPRHPPLPLDEATRGSLLAELDRPEDRLVVLLAGVHALSRSEITALRLADVDLAHGRLSFHGRRRVLDAPTRQALGDWLAERRRRWPYSANPHLLVSYKSAYDTGPVSTAYFTRPARLTGVTIAALRADRLLAEAGDTGGDPLSLVHLFGVSSDTAVRYCTDIDRDSRDQYWPARKRLAFANDPLNLLAVDGPTNEAKGDSDAASWLPLNKSYRCAYAARQIAVKSEYQLWMTRAECDAVSRVLMRCPEEVAPTGGTPTLAPFSATVQRDPASPPPAVAGGGVGMGWDGMGWDGMGPTVCDLQRG